jgi:hypothetical protein
LRLEGVNEAFEITPELLRATAAKFLFAVEEAGKVYRKIEAAKGKGNFIAEVSMDETDAAQTPAELLIILAAIADEGIPVQTIAPKFTGRFNKGVDYVGNVAQFRREMALDVAAIAWAVSNFGLPGNLKLSIHSGSDKFSIYPAIYETTKKSGVHLKTAGTTWLEEIIGLAEAGGDGLALAKEIYAEAYAHREELCAPYATVIDIDPAKLPAPGDGCEMDVGSIHLGAAPRSSFPGVQQQPAPAIACRIQGCRENGRSVSAPAGGEREGDCEKRNGKLVRPSHCARVSRQADAGSSSGTRGGQVSPRLSATERKNRGRRRRNLGHRARHQPWPGRVRRGRSRVGAPQGTGGRNRG